MAAPASCAKTIAKSLTSGQDHFNNLVMTAPGEASGGGPVSAKQLVVLVCAAQVFVQLGAFFWPALLPDFVVRWGLTNSEAGWITAAFYGAYIIAVPVLVTLTDRFDAKSVYLSGVAMTVAGHILFGLYVDGFWSATIARALTGMGWAGTYMTGLKLLADRVDDKLMSRATAGHAASIGISGAASFACADLIANVAGWRAAFILACVTAVFAWMLVAWAVPPRLRIAPVTTKDQALFDFRPVLRNRSAMAYGAVYCIHTLEMSALRGWGVAYLAFVATTTASTETVLSPAVTLTLLGLAGTLASVLGNEAAIYLGRRRLIGIALVASAICACLLGLIGPWSYLLAATFLVIYGPIVWLDSSSLTAGAAGTADPAKRGATLAVHSMLGYIGGFVGPLIIGWTLDLGGGMSHGTWCAAFMIIASLSIVGLVAFWLMRPRGLTGDRQS
jgi:predicted MFS family arabinose efflux permease